MWCAHCKSETSPAEHSSLRGLVCATCGTAVKKSTSTDSTIRQARDIIAKWSSSDLLDQISALPPIPPLPTPHISELSAKKTQPEPKAEPKAETQPEPKAEPQAETQAEPQPEPQVEPQVATPRQPNLQSEQTVALPPGFVRNRHKNQLATLPTEQTPATTKAGKVIPPKTEKAVHKKNGPHVLPTKTSPPQQTPQQRESILVTVAARKNENEKKNSQSTEASTLSPQPQTTATKQPGTPVQSPSTIAADQAHEVPKALDTNKTGPSRPRAKQSRTAQPRQQRERKLSAKAKHQGTEPVSRKFRIDTPGGEPTDAPEDAKANVAGARIQSNSATGRRHRIDAAEQVDATLETANARVRTQHRPRHQYIDEPHDHAARGPHFQVTAPKRSNLTSMTGQFLAYLGVLGLTVGTAIVIYGHFGGYSDYTPTGWLVTTVAQMMLFLGVINLVSGGIEQTNDDVSARINTLGEQLMRIEQVTEEALRGPKIPVSRYANPDADYEEQEMEVVGTRKRDA